MMYELEQGSLEIDVWIAAMFTAGLWGITFVLVIYIVGMFVLHSRIGRIIFERVRKGLHLK